MDRRERNRYDRNDYGPDYNSYDRDDAHYHHARNLTNEFEQEYQSHHPDMDSDRYRYMRDRDRGGVRQSYHEGNMGDAYERMREERGAGRSNSSYNMRYGEQDMDTRRNNRNQNRENSGNYGRDSSRYSQRNEEFGDRTRDRYGDRDPYGSQERRGGMGQGRMREGYGISDYGRMGQSSVHSNRGIPNAGITSSFSDDFGPTDFDRDRSHGLSSGNYGAYGSHSGGFGRNRNDR